MKQTTASEINGNYARSFHKNELYENELPLQFIAYKFNCLWPLRTPATSGACWLRLCGLALSVICYVGTVFGEFTFIFAHIGDIPAIAECMTTTLIGVQCLLRITVIAWRNDSMRKLLARFYSEIYISERHDPEVDLADPKKYIHLTRLNARVRKYMRVISITTKSYYIPAALICIMFLLELGAQGMQSLEKPYFYRSVYRWYDAQAPLPYVITSCYTGWLTLSTVGVLSSEDYLLCMVLCHTSQRYKQLQWMLSDLFEQQKQQQFLTRRVGVQYAAFKRSFYDILRRQQRLCSFVQMAKSHFTHQIFYTIVFGVLLNCVVMFHFQRTNIGIDWVKYIIWLFLEIAQFIMIGFFGQMLSNESSNLCLSYYQCGWEYLLLFGHQAENKSLLRDIQFAILNTTNAVSLDGFKIFQLTHQTIGMALRTAMSYFMFLNTMNNANRKDK